MEILSMPEGVSSTNASTGQDNAAEPSKQVPISTNVSITPDNLAEVSNSRPEELSEYDKAVLKSFAETDAEVHDTHDEDSGKNDVDVQKHVDSDPLLKAATALDRNSAVSSTTIKVSEEHRKRFLDCIVTGERYTETFDIFGGRIHGKIRCRSLDETEAIEAHIRRQIIIRKIVSQAEYTALVRRALLSAQVEEINGVKFPELEKPLFAVETEEGLTQPGWIGRLETWGSKPDALIMTVVGKILDFEARYWAMIRSSENENFWKTGEFTEE